MEDEKKFKLVNRNIKIFPSYLALTWDVIFVWTISTMFFSTQKGLSYSQTISLDSILMIIGCIICIPVNKLFENVKAVVATRIATLGYVIYFLLVIFGENYSTFILAQFFLSFGYCLNSVKVNSILNQSLYVVNKGKDYQRIYGKGKSLFYVIEAVGAIAITYVYSWQPYVAYWIGLGVALFAILISFFITEPHKFQERNITITDNVEPQTKTKTKNSSMFKILKSGFFVCLLLFMFLIRGSLSVVGSSIKIYLQQLTDASVIPVWIFGYLYAGTKVSAAISSKYQFKFNLKFGVRSLVLFTVAIIMSFAIMGVVYLINPTSIVSIIIICVMSYILNAIYSPCAIFANNYMQVCMPPQDIEKAYSIRTTVEYLGFGIISAAYAALLSMFGDNCGLTNLVCISILAVPLIVAMAVFIKLLCKKYAQKYTIIKDEYVNDD